MKIRNVIRYVDAIKPNAFGDEVKVQWINEAEGYVQTDVMMLALSDVVQYDPEQHMDAELLVKPPHDKLYAVYLCAMVDFANGEYDKYANTMQMYNEFLGEYIKWYTMNFRPADGRCVREGYYLSAYSIASLHGFDGTEEEWLEHLKGAPGRSAYEDAVAHGYTGTEEEFGRDQARFAENATAVRQMREQAEAAASSAAGSAENARQSANNASSDANAAAKNAAAATTHAQSAYDSANRSAQFASDANSAKDTAVTAEKAAQESANSAAEAKNAAENSANSAGRSAQEAQSAEARAEEAAEKAGKLVENIHGTGMWYGTTSSEVRESIKEVTTVSGDFRLEKGSQVSVKFLTNSEYCQALNVDGTGVVYIHESYVDGAEDLSAGTAPNLWHNLGQINTFIYDGKYFIVEDGVRATADNQLFGKVGVSDSVKLDSGDYAASSRAVKRAYDKAVEAYEKAGSGGGSGGGISQETDPTVPDWAKQPEKPTYTASEVGALPATTKIPEATSDLDNDSGYITIAVATLLNYYLKTETYAKTETYSQTEVDNLISGLDKRLNAIADSEDVDLDQLSEIVAYIKANKSLIDSITTDKVNVADIIDNLTTADSKKPLSAAQGKALKEMYDALPAWAKAASKPTYTKSEVGLGNVDNVRQYSAQNPPPYPVTSVNGMTGAVMLNANHVRARPETWMPSASEVGADPSGTADSKVAAHNVSETSHNDIRLLITGLTNRLNALANSTDDDLDQLAEIVAYIKANKSLIDSITTSKVSVADIIDNLTTNASNKPLSAKMGVQLKALIDAIKIPTTLPASDVYDWAKQPDPPKYTAADVGAATKKQVDDLSKAIANQQTAIDGKQPKGNYATATQLDALSTDVGKYATLTLGVNPEDGKVYIYKSGSPIGSGVELGSDGDVVGYVDASNRIVISGELADGTYTVAYAMADGSEVDIGELVLGIAFAEFTNLVPTAKDGTGEIMGGKGYLRDNRITATVNSSYSGSTIAKAASGFTIVGLMSVGNMLTGDVYVYGLEFSGASSDKIVTYDNSTYKCKYAAELLKDGFSDGKAAVTKLGDLYYKLSLSFVSSFQNIAISGHTGDSGIEPIVTLNQPIFKG